MKKYLISCVFLFAVSLLYSQETTKGTVNHSESYEHTIIAKLNDTNWNEIKISDYIKNFDKSEIITRIEFFIL